MSAPPLSTPVTLELYSSSFCGACRQTRAVLDEVARLLTDVDVVEYNLALHPDVGERSSIDATPTVIMRSDATEFFRSSGVPSVDQVLSEIARHAFSP